MSKWLSEFPSITAVPIERLRQLADDFGAESNGMTRKQLQVFVQSASDRLQLPAQCDNNDDLTISHSQIDEIPSFLLYNIKVTTANGSKTYCYDIRDLAQSIQYDIKRDPYNRFLFSDTAENGKTHRRNIINRIKFLHKVISPEYLTEINTNLDSSAVDSETEDNELENLSETSDEWGDEETDESEGEQIDLYEGLRNLIRVNSASPDIINGFLVHRFMELPREEWPNFSMIFAHYLAQRSFLEAILHARSDTPQLTVDTDVVLVAYLSTFASRPDVFDHTIQEIALGIDERIYQFIFELTTDEWIPSVTLDDAWCERFYLTSKVPVISCGFKVDQLVYLWKYNQQRNNIDKCIELVRAIVQIMNAPDNDVDVLRLCLDDPVLFAEVFSSSSASMNETFLNSLSVEEKLLHIDTLSAYLTIPERGDVEDFSRLRKKRRHI